MEYKAGLIVLFGLFVALSGCSQLANAPIGADCFTERTGKECNNRSN